MIARVPVSSRNLAEVGYDAESRVLEILFMSGKMYHYQDVPEWIYLDLIDGTMGSIGRYFHAVVKNKYKGWEVKDDAPPAGAASSG